MKIKPSKPDKKIVKANKDLEKAVAKSKATKADTKALEVVNKELKTATRELSDAMDDCCKKFGLAYTMSVDVCKTPAPPGPVPIPYPVIAKAEKSSKQALKTFEAAQKKHGKVSEKLIKLVDKETKVLGPYAKASGGDAAATIKGLISAKTMAKAQMVQASFVVKAEGKNIARYFDVLNQNIKKAEKKR